MRRIRHISLTIAALALAWWLVLLVFGGVETRLLGFRIRSTNPFRPFWVGLAAIVSFLAAGGRGHLEELETRVGATRVMLLRHATVVACLLSTVGLIVGVAFNTRVGIASDTYGYVSQADLWLQGELKQAKPWMAEVPWRENRWGFSPLGYRPAPGDELAVVPTYSPGLPMVMALAKRVGGQCGLFLVVPLFGAVAVFSTYLLGRRLGAPASGLMAAALLSMSPAFLAMIVEPLSDVPAMAAWSLAWWYVLGRTGRHALAAGLLASLAILIRPNLVVLAVPMAVWLLVEDKEPVPRTIRMSRAAIFAAATIPGIAAVAFLNNYLFGSALSSGYGTPRELFAWSRIGSNLSRYFGWYVESQSPLAIAGIAAIAVPLRACWPEVVHRRVFSLIGAEVALLWLLYLAYFTFEDWGYLRFLLPSWPFLMLGLAGVVRWVGRLVGPRSVLVRATVVAASLGGLMTWQTAFTRAAGVFDYQRSEQHEVRLAQLVRNATPVDSIVLTIERSGTIRYYAGRETLRYDYLDADTLDRDLAWIEGHGIQPYALLDRRELNEFRLKFAGAAAVSALDRPTLVYQPRDVQLFALGKPVGTAAGPLIVHETAAAPLGCIGPADPPSLPW
jgi:hypothetical protein